MFTIANLSTVPAWTPSAAAWDLRDAVIREDEEIDVRTYMGGVEIYVPANVNVIVKSNSFIGGTDNQINRNEIANAPCLHIVASNFLGGVTIRS